MDKRTRDQLAWDRRPRVPCRICGEPTGWPVTDKRAPVAPKHNRCREHGTVAAYKLGCRCDECRDANNRDARRYAKRVLDRDGHSPTQKARPPKRRRCVDCGAVLKAGGWAADGEPRCMEHRQQVRARRARAKSRRRRAESRLRKAAAGRSANPRWFFTQGTCAWCSEAFCRRGMVSPYCSKRCNRKARAAMNRVLRGKQWISGKERHAIYERDQWICQLCEEPVDRNLDHWDPMSATLDHIECRSWTLVPDDRPENLRLAHRICNSIRGDESHVVSRSALVG